MEPYLLKNAMFESIKEINLTKVKKLVSYNVYEKSTQYQLNGCFS